MAQPKRSVGLKRSQLAEKVFETSTEVEFSLMDQLQVLNGIPFS
jgi:hypothetical protein